MSTEGERVNQRDDAAALHLNVRLEALQHHLSQKLAFTLRILKVLVRAPRYLQSHLLSFFFIIDGEEHLPERSLVQKLCNLVPVPDLLADARLILAIGALHLIFLENSERAYAVDAWVFAEFTLFKGCQFICVLKHCLLLSLAAAIWTFGLRRRRSIRLGWHVRTRVVLLVSRVVMIARSVLWLRLWLLRHIRPRFMHRTRLRWLFHRLTSLQVLLSLSLGLLWSTN